MSKLGVIVSVIAGIGLLAAGIGLLALLSLYQPPVRNVPQSPNPVPYMMIEPDGTFLEEDEPGWDCALYGNGRCGIEL